MQLKLATKKPYICKRKAHSRQLNVYELHHWDQRAHTKVAKANASNV